MPGVRHRTVQAALQDRFQDADHWPMVDIEQDILGSMAMRGSCRSFTGQPVCSHLMNTLCALALASPTKSDLQQRDIILLRSESRRRDLAKLVAGQEWVAKSPMIAIFCGNNRRQRLLHEWQGVPFANDHIDTFLNAAADAAIALGAFVAAAEAVGLGCCPISAVRNDAQAVSDLLELPEHVFPFAGLAIGHPKETPEVSMRLPLSVTCHEDTYKECDLKSAIEDYDGKRRVRQPYKKQRYPEVFETSSAYGWSDDKVRQYSQPEREHFGQFLRAKGFSLE